MIRALRAHFAGIAAAEAERTLGKLHDLDPRTRHGVEAMAQAIVNKLLHAPTMALKDEADLAAANISITARREVLMDFSQPIFESGLQIMVQADDVRQPSLLRALLSWDLAAAIGIAFLLLFGGGMVMWAFERRAQPYFDRPLKEAWFPSFWWALNLVLNGGFEERMPRSPLGRVLGVMMVISSLFFVSLFVARITAAMTVTALTSSVTSLSDLDNRTVGTVAGNRFPVATAWSVEATNNANPTPGMAARIASCAAIESVMTPGNGPSSLIVPAITT